MARETTSRAFNVGGAEVRVTLPDEVVEAVKGAWEQTVAGPRGRRTSKRAAQTEARERLSAERIVDVALEQMRIGGYDAVTMRSIARELGTGPASLYAHVAGREELDALVLDRITTQVQVPDPDPEHWDDQIRQVMRDMLELFRAHPGVARASLGMIPLQPGALVVFERLLAILKAGGVPDQYAAWFGDLMALYVAAVGVEDDIWRTRGGDEGRTEEEVVAHVRQFMSSLPAAYFPLLSSMALAMTTGGGDERFDFGVDVLVAGLKALSQAAPDGPTR